MLELLTKNAAGNGWVDFNPGAVSTGYHAQNVALQAGWVGRDDSFLIAGTNKVVLKPSGIVDDFGVPFMAKKDLNIAIPAANDTYWLYLEPSADNLRREVTATTKNPVWLPGDNCYVVSNANGRQCRVLNWLVVRRASGISVMRLNQINAPQTEWFFSEDDTWRCPVTGRYLVLRVSGSGEGGSGGGGGGGKSWRNGAGGNGGSGGPLRISVQEYTISIGNKGSITVGKGYRTEGYPGGSGGSSKDYTGGRGEDGSTGYGPYGGIGGRGSSKDAERGHNGGTGRAGNYSNLSISSSSVKDLRITDIPATKVSPAKAARALEVQAARGARAPLGG